MSFSRFAIGFSRHRKVSRLSDAAFRLWTSAIDYAREQLTGGEVEPLDIDALPRVPVGKKRADLISELVEVGLWEQTESGTWLIHDFADWQDSPEQVRQKKADARERMKRVRDTRSPSVRANIERTSREVLLTGSSPEVLLTDPSLHSSPDLSSGSFKLSSGSDRSRARGPQKPGKSEHVPGVLPDNWLPDARQLAALAAKYEVPEARVTAQVAEFVWYWTAGNGAGSRKTGRGWAATFGNQIESAAKRQVLYSGVVRAIGPAAAAVAPDEAAKRLAERDARAAEQLAKSEAERARRAAGGQQ